MIVEKGQMNEPSTIKSPFSIDSISYNFGNLQANFIMLQNDMLSINKTMSCLYFEYFHCDISFFKASLNKNELMVLMIICTQNRIGKS